MRTIHLAVLILAASTAFAQQDSAKPLSDNQTAPPDSTQLIMVKAPPLTLPPEAVEKHIQGQVRIKVLISEEGTVEEAEAVSGDPILAEEALAEARQLQFKPYFRGGVAVKVSTVLPFDFTKGSSLPAGAHPDSRELVTIKRTKMSYPLSAREQGIQGKVVLKLHVEEDGKVGEIEVVSGHPLLVDEAKRSAKNIQFEPFYRGGKPVPIVTTMPFDFFFSDKTSDAAAPAATPIANTPPESSGTKLIHVSPGVVQGMLLHRVNPVYPPQAKANHISGTVVLQAVIGKDGRIHSLFVVSGPPELRQAALGAVEQWRYRPYVLNGEPVEVDTQVTVNFTLNW